MWKAEEHDDLPELEEFKPIPDKTMCEFTVAGASVDKREADDGGVKVKFKLVFAVDGGPHDGRKVWESYNISGHSEKGDKIGNGVFKRFMAAIGKTSMESMEELVGESFVGRVGIKKENGKLWNKINSYYAIGEANADAPGKSQPKSAGWDKPAGAKADW